MSRRLPIVLLIILILAALFLWWTRPPAAPEPPALTLAPITPTGEFARALVPQPIELPADHGPHPDYQTEWWYYTGNLTSREGRRFGYQLTFFRRAMTAEAPARSSAFAADQIYFAHFAVTDVRSGEHREWERFSRGAAGLAGAQADPFRVWLEDWSVTGRNEEASAVDLTAAAGDSAIQLELAASKPLVRHGDNGLSPKSEEPGNASYYLSYTRMATEGRVTVAGQAHEVQGESWFDHEWSTSALGPQAVGWDWFSLQFDDGSELMYFQIRRADGSLSPVSSGTWVAPDGGSRTVESAAVELEVLDRWTSPESEAVYPMGWRLAVPSEGLTVDIEPLLQNQEMNVTTVYWEGAVVLAGRRDGDPITGQGYVELTGYAGSMQGRF